MLTEPLRSGPFARSDRPAVQSPQWRSQVSAAQSGRYVVEGIVVGTILGMLITPMITWLVFGLEGAANVVASSAATTGLALLGAALGSAFPATPQVPQATFPRVGQYAAQWPATPEGRDGRAAA